MAARPDRRFPAAEGQVLAAGEHLVDVAHGEGQVVDARPAGRRLQQEQVVMAVARRAAQEHAAIVVGVRQVEAQNLAVEGGTGGGVRHVEHDMADLQRLGPLVEAGAGVDPVDVLRRIGGRRRDLGHPQSGYDEFEGEPGRVDRPHARPFGEATDVGQPVPYRLDIGVGLHAPADRPDGRSRLDRRRQRPVAPAFEDHARSVRRGENGGGLAGRPLLQAEIGPEAPRFRQVGHAVGDSLDPDKPHRDLPSPGFPGGRTVLEYRAPAFRTTGL